MASSVTQKQTLNCRDIPTESVTLYANKAAIVRQLSYVNVKPGINQVEVTGFTPLIDESSLKVDGSGAATITDLSVLMEHNPEKFYDMYPDDEDEDGAESDSSDDDDDEEDSEEVEKLRDELKDTEKQIFAAKEGQSSIQKRLLALNAYCEKMNPRDADVDKLQALINAYGKQRAELFQEDEILKEKIVTKEKLKEKQEKALDRATKASRVQKERLQRQKRKEKAATERKKRDKKAEKKRVRQERVKFWPRFTYKVVVTLEVAVGTPTTLSRRTSMSSVTMSPNKNFDKEADTDVREVTQSESDNAVSLTISYITSGASWKPRYDINFSTVNKNGSIVYRAELKNETSETWDDARIWLSNSQASFVGVGDECPEMRPWRVQLQKAYGAVPDTLLSIQEKHKPVVRQQQLFGSGQIYRPDLFGVDDYSVELPRQRQQQFQQAYQKQHEGMIHPRNMVQSTQPPQAPGGIPRGLFGNTNTNAAGSSNTGGLFGGSAHNNTGNLFGANNNTRAAGLFGGATAEKQETKEAAESTHVERQMQQPQHPEVLEFFQEEQVYGQDTIDFEETSFEDHGFTTQFELPGKRSLVPSSDARRHKIATLAFSNLVMSTISVPKLRPAAFLRAQFRNPSSSITLLRGSAGVTLDGSFLGNVNLKRASPHELITMPLGVDPAVHISYAKPTVLNSKQGMITKSSTQLSTRSIVITNTKKTALEMLVLDQVPTSQDEKLAIEIVSPKGLYHVGDGVRTGSNARPQPEGKPAAKWGSARVELKKGGKIVWTVNLEKSAAVQLPFEFETKGPADENVVSVN